MGVPSRAGETSNLDMVANRISFSPLSALTPESQALQDKYLAPLRARMDSGSYPPGLRKQYEVQLEHLRSQVPSCEVLMAQSFSLSARKRDRALFLMPALLNTGP